MTRLCKCHDVEMKLHRRASGRNSYECRVKIAEADARYERTAKAKARCARYRATENGRALQLAAQRRYEIKRYDTDPVYRLGRVVKASIRRREARIQQRNG